jgi:DNA-binding NarL/FixJ family response regulator
VRLQFVASAEQALRLAHKTAVDLWVVNSKLPGLSGCELCRILKSQSARAAVYVVADEYSPEVEQEARASRASLFGCKPEHAHWLRDWHDTVSPGRSNKRPTIAARL